MGFGLLIKNLLAAFAAALGAFWSDLLTWLGLGG